MYIHRTDTSASATDNMMMWVGAEYVRVRRLINEVPVANAYGLTPHQTISHQSPSKFIIFLLVLYYRRFGLGYFLVCVVIIVHHPGVNGPHRLYHSFIDVPGFCYIVVLQTACIGCGRF
ncbi:hypothetical protein EDC01DRAFT_667925 [Geopyxis carbonaria]|nr:hypothetical protein EDC01DRAFT_667925 [Geopyxis carbonaria]